MLDKARTAVIFIEFQAEWLAEDGLLYKALMTDKAALRKAVEQAESVLAAARKNSWQIVHAGLDMRNDPTYRIFAGGKNVMGLRAAIPAAETWLGKGAEFIAPFMPQQNEFVVSGRSGASIFTGSNLNSYLKNNKIDTLIMMGFATHVCVESSLREAHDAGYNVYIVTDASSGFIQEQDIYFAKHVLHHFGVGVTATQLTDLLAR
ncbi:MAG: cysteine hydrolase family protein [Desulfovibrio sp.]|jgi:nicotinamidase-related amidase|nr:cysteine hydrolase family protein [Desulfovibrio sp.]